ncbi:MULTISPECIES: hypothetical protein [Curtobacterium]|uniref:Uncharacterized protein n=1 Tax=Curtobacterium citreum TaxID=2036 RepID=A0ABT2HED5_9MICO|nr:MULTISPECIES: hypothetical protein [Curtobacterium]MCS6521640.1 hypothetical protein [Curtobacterium citreum]TQJ27028.1 hypothetical protein FB462_0875 [Curtobacterium citreum]
MTATASKSSVRTIWSDDGDAIDVMFAGWAESTNDALSLTC